MIISETLKQLAESKNCKVECGYSPKWGDHITLIDKSNSHRRVITHNENTAEEFLNAISENSPLPVYKSNK